MLIFIIASFYNHFWPQGPAGQKGLGTMKLLPSHHDRQVIINGATNRARLSLVRSLVRCSLPLLAFTFSLAAAQGGGLYGPGMPDDAAFIRVVHAVPDGPEVTVTVGGGLTGETLAFGMATAYELVLSGPTPVLIEFDDGGNETGGDTLETTVEIMVEVTAESFYTVALAGRAEAPELLVIEDEVTDNLAQSLLSLYNFTEHDLDLMTAGGETEVVTGVGFGEAKGVQVNPVTVALAVFFEGEPLYELGEVGLEAGEAYSVIVFGPPGTEGAVSLVRAASRD